MIGDSQEFIYSHTSLSTWRRCRYQFFLKYIEGYRTPTSPGGQMTGLLGHVALAEWYKQPNRYGTECQAQRADRIATEAAWTKLLEEMEVAGQPVDVDGFEATKYVLQRYYDWARIHDHQWEVIAPEFEFKVKIGAYPIMGFIDLIVKEKDQVWLVEHKFYKQVSTTHLDLDPQVSTYMLGALVAGYNPVGVIYNMVRTTTGPTAEREPVVRRPLYRNQEGLMAKAKEMVLQMAEMDEFMKEGGRIYRTETRDCHWSCPYHQVCLSITDEGSGDAILSSMDKRPSIFLGDDTDEE